MWIFSWTTVKPGTTLLRCLFRHVLRSLPLSLLCSFSRSLLDLLLRNMILSLLCSFLPFVLRCLLCCLPCYIAYSSYPSVLVPAFCWTSHIFDHSDCLPRLLAAALCRAPPFPACGHSPVIWGSTVPAPPLHVVVHWVNPELALQQFVSPWCRAVPCSPPSLKSFCHCCYMMSFSSGMPCCIACSAYSFRRSVPSNLHMSYTCHPTFIDWWLFLLLETVIYPCLRVYVAQIVLKSM